MKSVRPAKRHWYHYLWLYSLFFFAAGFFNILFAWLGLVSFLLPLVFAFGFGTKGFCNRYCDRGQFLRMFGGQLGLSRGHAMPSWMKGKPFRYAFMVFFFAMFGNIIYTTWLIAHGAGSLSEVVTILWSVRVPWQWAYAGGVEPWVASFAFQLYSLMLTSEIIALATMLWFRPRSWCVYCPMGTLTQLVCKRKASSEEKMQEGDFAK